MKIFIVKTRCPYYQEDDNNFDTAFMTRELAERYINDWNYRNDYTIEEFEVRETYKETYNFGT